MFRRLVNSQTLKVDLTAILQSCKSKIKLDNCLLKLLNVLVDKAPNVEELTIGANNKMEDVRVTEGMMTKLAKLCKLKSLKISSIFKFDYFFNLGSMCHAMPDLQVISASVKGPATSLSSVQILHLEKCFPSLIVHCIKSSHFEPWLKELDERCRRNAEKLEKVYQDESKIFNWESNLMDVKLSRHTIYAGSPGKFRRISIEVEERSKQKHVGNKYHRYCKVNCWEHLTDRLVPVDQLTESQDASRFNIIHFVDGGESFPETMKVNPASCWPNVHTFTMESVYEMAYLEVELSVIAERCPNLERLIIKEMFNVYIVKDPALNALKLSSLRVLDLVVQPHHRTILPSHILSVAPNLEKVRLEGTAQFFTTEDLKVVTSMIADGLILRKLQTLHIALRAVSMGMKSPTAAFKVQLQDGKPAQTPASLEGLAVPGPVVPDPHTPFVVIFTFNFIHRTWTDSKRLRRRTNTGPHGRAGTPSTDARGATNPELELFLPSHSRRVACVFAVVSSNFLISAEFKMVDVEYYAMTKKKVFSLQEMAFDTAVKNLGRYKELTRSKVSPPFRKELYDEAMKSVWEKTYEERFGLLTTLPYLEPYKMEESFHFREFAWAIPVLKVNPRGWIGCDFDDDGEFYYATCNAILSYLGQNAPNLKELYIVNLWPYDLKEVSKKFLLDSKSFQINFTGFVRICREFQNVQEIEAENIFLDVPKSDLRAILEEFNTAFDHQEYTERTFPTKFGILFKRTDSAEIYRKAQVELDDSIFVDSLPELTHLRTYCGEEYQRHMMNFQHILSKNIFEHCVYLESLDLCDSYIADANEQLNSFGKLKELCYADEFQALTLKSILCAPLLEKIHLKSLKFDLGDKEALFNQIRRGEISGTPSTDARRATNPELELFLPSHSRRVACVFAVVSSNFLISAEFKMVDVEYNAVTEKRVFSLQEMAFDTAVKNLGRYKELIRSKVSPPFRKELYEVAMKSVWKKTYEERFGLWTTLPYLEPHKMVNPRGCTGCDFDDDDEFFDATCNAILSYLGQHAPNLIELYIVYLWPYDLKEISKKPLLDSKSFQINFTGFVRICRESQNVQEIEATKILLDVPKSDLRAILEEFNTAFDHQKYTKRTFPKKFGILFKRTDSAEIYREARVDLDDTIFVDSLPELTHLTIFWDDCKDYQCNTKNFQHILSKLGGSLKKLSLRYFSRKSKLTFKKIFEHCEYLESLDLCGSYIADANEPLSSFGKLKEFDWYYADEDHALTLKSILCAPLLEKINLKSLKFDLGDKEALFNQIRRAQKHRSPPRDAPMDYEAA
ncbi:Hypothetical predicted protein [Cloeon dipterum]|uniref:Uncharacterized protein n=1 Tax=Cloeon dipterum TaxID=197152 RepID=A0A8S1D1S2_9INSE|nr:Hypothetical predicted protein [Cloeon dipterum]